MERTKQKITSKIMAIALVIALAVTMMPLMADDVHAAPATTDPLNFIGGDPIDIDELETEGWKWEDATRTLTLKNCNLNVTGNFNAITVPSNTTIKLEGVNNIKLASANDKAMIKARGNLNIIGDGRLALGLYASCVSSVGIDASMEGEGTLTTDCKAIQISGGLYAIYTKNVIIKGGEFLLGANTQVWANPNNGMPNITLPSSYKYTTDSKVDLTLYDSKKSGSVPYTPSAAHKYLRILPYTSEGSTIPAKGTIFPSGKQNFKITDPKTDGNGTVTDMGFAKGKSAKSVKIPKTVKYEGITYKVTAIAAKAYKGEKKITSVTIGNNVKTIGNSAFYKATKLKKITLGTSVTKIGKHVFCHDTKLKTIDIKSKKLKSVGKHVLFKAKNLKIKVPKSKVKKYKKLFKNKGQKKSAKVRVVKR